MVSCLLLLVLGCQTAPEETPRTESCGSNVDEDEDGLVDCEDPDCAEICTEDCTDGLDNDLDGLRDCADPDCDGRCVEDCTDGRDNDGDVYIDCDDADCIGLCPEDCDNGEDDDGDGLFDCDDADCHGDECSESCANGLDEDADGLVDCLDPDCDGQCPEDCFDERDNDGDGDIDCDDADCNIRTCPEQCLNGRDDDDDGLQDCDDPNCIDDCDADRDGSRNPEHGGGDCDDTDPASYPGALDICEDGTDQDCDGFDRTCFPRNCQAAWDAGERESGPYTLDLLGDGSRQFDVWCDMDDGGWTPVLVKNSVHSDPMFDDGIYAFGVEWSFTDRLAADPARSSDGDERTPMIAWLEINALRFDHLRLTAWSDGRRTYTSDAISRDELNVRFGQSGYYLWNAPADPPRGDGMTYTWCAGDAAFTDDGMGQFNQPDGAPEDCKGHTDLGGGWDFSMSVSPEQGLTLTGGGDVLGAMTGAWQSEWVLYPAPGAAQAIWVR
ncbi:MAG: hypothetical protein ACI8PZ_001144 [Myxococcota bacterium]|jgi:hypothetical protein